MNIRLNALVRRRTLQCFDRSSARIIHFSEDHGAGLWKKRRRHFAQSLVAHGAEDHRDWLFHELIQKVAQGAGGSRIVRAVEKDSGWPFPKFQSSGMRGRFDSALDCVA